ncbi:MAG: DUF4404 family protein [Lentisphaerales bacterium]|nr:DUF4404 family protein [Lentisphaerales bacterium]
MIEEKLNRIEEKIRQAPSMQDENKESVLNLLEDLKEELQSVSREDSERLSSTGSFAEAGTNEVVREGGDKGILDIALNGVRESVKEFEESHPKLVQVMNSICTQLSNSGL